MGFLYDRNLIIIRTHSFGTGMEMCAVRKVSMHTVACNGIHQKKPKLQLSHKFRLVPMLACFSACGTLGSGT